MAKSLAAEVAQGANRSCETSLMVGLAALSLLADAAQKQLLLCVIDDAQWLAPTPLTQAR